MRRARYCTVPAIGPTACTSFLMGAYACRARRALTRNCFTSRRREECWVRFRCSEGAPSLLRRARPRQQSAHTSRPLELSACSTRTSHSRGSHCAVLPERGRGLLRRIDELTATTITARVADYVRSRSEKSLGDEFILGMSQEELARELGTAREVIVRALRALIAAGAVERAGRARFRA